MADQTILEITDGGAAQSGDKVHVVRGPNSRAAALGGASALDVGTGAGTVAAGDDSRIVGAVQSSALDTDATLAANSDAKIATQKAVKAFVAAAIANLLDSAPGALDTLNELAAALGDDPNFATTVTNALAGKLAIASNLSDLASASTALTNLGLSANGKSLVTATDYAAMKTLLSLVKADVGLGNVDNTSDASKNSATATLTNKRITARIGSTTSSSTPTPSADDHDQYEVTALAAAATFGAPTGTPTDGQKLMLRIKDNGTIRTLGWNSIYRAVGITLPTATVAGKTIYVGAIYNAADSKWDCVGLAQEA